jgi:hypothetical protein
LGTDTENILPETKDTRVQENRVLEFVSSHRLLPKACPTDSLETLEFRNSKGA